MKNKFKHCMIWAILMVCSIWMVPLAFAEEGPAPASEMMVQGSDDFVVLREEMDFLEERLRQTFRTTESEYCRAVMRMKLFTREARILGLDQIPQNRLHLEMLMAQELSNIYIRNMLDAYDIHPHAVESYYWSHTGEFSDQNGKLMPLDDDLQAVIRDRLMQTRRAEMVGKELDRLMEKYDVEIVNPVCHKKEE